MCDNTFTINFCGFLVGLFSIVWLTSNLVNWIEITRKNSYAIFVEYQTLYTNTLRANTLSCLLYYEMQAWRARSVIKRSRKFSLLLYGQRRFFFLFVFRLFIYFFYMKNVHIRVYNVLFLWIPNELKCLKSWCICFLFIAVSHMHTGIAYRTNIVAGMNFYFLQTVYAYAHRIDTRSRVKLFATENNRVVKQYSKWRRRCLA